MSKLLTLVAATLTLACAAPARAAEPQAKLVVKPLLCVLDRDDAGCHMTFNVKWAALIAAEYCLNIDLVRAPLKCWERTQTGELREKRLVNQDFSYWLGAAAGSERLAEVKVQVMRIGSDDRRRERRTRHAWDVL
jgi:hypothetical protein